VTAAGIAERTTFTGPLSETAVTEAYCAADVFVLPSLQENFGNAIIEAMAAGCPVVIGDRLDLAGEIDRAALAWFARRPLRTPQWRFARSWAIRRLRRRWARTVVTWCFGSIGGICRPSSDGRLSRNHWTIFGRPVGLILSHGRRGAPLRSNAQGGPSSAQSLSADLLESLVDPVERKPLRSWALRSLRRRAIPIR